MIGFRTLSRDLLCVLGAITKLFARLLLTVDFFVVYVVNLEESMAE